MVRVPGGRRVDVELQPGLGGQLHALEVEVELTDHGVAHPLATAAVEPDALTGPALLRSIQTAHWTLWCTCG